MIITIDGIMYDTAKAQVIADHRIGDGDDIGCGEETLYKTDEGEYFKYCELYFYPEGKSAGACTYSEFITPLTLDEARQMGEEYMDPMEFKRAFGLIPYRCKESEASEYELNIDIPNHVYEALVADVKRQREQSDWSGWID